MKYEEPKLSTKGMLVDIQSMIPYLRNFLDKRKPYCPLVEHMTQVSLEEQAHSIKELSKKSGITYIRLRKMIKDLYWDLMMGYNEEKDEEISFQFTRLTYYLHIHGLFEDRLALLTTHSLPIHPRVGEEMEIPFFREYLVTYRFKVVSISHRLFQDEQRIDIDLRLRSRTA